MYIKIVSSKFWCFNRNEAMIHKTESSDNCETRVTQAQQEIHNLDQPSNDIDNNKPALILYTSGSTGPPKGQYLS